MSGRGSPRRLVVLLIAATLAGGCAQPDPTPDPTPGPTSEPAPPRGVTGPAPLVGGYVALGDSYAAGPGIPAASGVPVGCGRSTHSYPARVDTALRYRDFRDVSCAGARLADMATPQRTSNGTNPPQLDALDADVRLVTITVGGNDIGFGDVVLRCLKGAGGGPAGCAELRAGGHDLLADRVARVAPQLTAVLTEIHRRSPAAAVLVVGYPTILPPATRDCDLTWGGPADVAYLDATERSLNAMLEQRAGAAGARFVDLAADSIDHDICQPPGSRWVEGATPATPAAPFHPNAAGMAHAAARVLAARLIS